MFPTDADIAAAERFEKAWAARIGGDATLDLRFTLGLLCGRIVSGHGVDPKDLLAYLAAVLEEGDIPPTLKSV